MTTWEILQKLSRGFLNSEEALKLIHDNEDIKNYCEHHSEDNILELLDEVKAGITTIEGFLEETGESIN